MESFRSFSLKVLATMLVFLCARVADAGTRYKDIVFPTVTTTSNIQFGSNLNIDGSNAPLFLDLYEPANDTLTSRPLVICIHGGAFSSAPEAT